MAKPKTKGKAKKGAQKRAEQPSAAPAAAPQPQPTAAPTAKATVLDELARLDAMGLREEQVAGTHYTLVTMKDKEKIPTLEQRVEIAKRLNEVGPKLPRYIPGATRMDADKPSQSAQRIIGEATKHEEKKMTKKGAGALPAGIDPKEIEKAHAQSVKEAEERDRQKAKEDKAKAKKEEADRAAAAKARKKLKGKSVAPTRAQAKPDPKPAKGKAAKPDAVAKPKGGIGGLVVRMLKEGKETPAIIAAVKKEYPKARTSPASVAWYRSKLASGELK